MEKMNKNAVVCPFLPRLEREAASFHARGKYCLLWSDRIGQIGPDWIEIVIFREQKTSVFFSFGRLFLLLLYAIMLVVCLLAQ
mmetsp:Transcript_39743/g.82629  ORF Transcript_39743/g.82629 Transcript_39743/m.82629 type:complete len:83 (-) Transcript_39743:1721-1969(-)